MPGEKPRRNSEDCWRGRVAAGLSRALPMTSSGARTARDGARSVGLSVEVDDDQLVLLDDHLEDLKAARAV